jgi:pilus assembly protein CpaB
MKPARLAVLAIALVAGGSAAFLMSQTKPQIVKETGAPVPANTVDVLVAATDVTLGKTLQANEMRWLAWPAESVPTGIIRKDTTPNALTDTVGSFARVGMVANEPIRSERLLKADGSGFLSAILPSGKRAVAITTERSGASTAGGFILPNDRVDVIRTTREDESGNKSISSEIILTNVRVLAIGQNIQEKDGEKVVVGETATLELEPKQTEAIALAQKTGQLSLALRSLADAKDVSQSRTGDDATLNIVRFGVVEKIAKQ